jgi:hypothetical protein
VSEQPARQRGKRPTAVVVVGLVASIAMVANLAIGASMLWQLWQQGAAQAGPETWIATATPAPVGTAGPVTEGTAAPGPTAASAPTAPSTQVVTDTALIPVEPLPMPRIALGLTVTPRGESAFAGLFFLLTGIVMAIILVAFFRLRPWSWVALMAWSGFMLAASLVRFLNHQPAYGPMILLVIVVLLLNQEDLQITYHVKQQADERPVIKSDPNHRV